MGFNENFARWYDDDGFTFHVETRVPFTQCGPDGKMTLFDFLRLTTDLSTEDIRLRGTSMGFLAKQNIARMSERLSSVADVYRQVIGEDAARGCAEAGKHINAEHPAALPPDFSKIRLKQKKRNREGHQIRPYKVIGGCVCRDNAKVCQNHSKDETEHTGRHLGRPQKALFESNGNRGNHNQNCKQHPGIIG